MNKHSIDKMWNQRNPYQLGEKFSPIFNQLDDIFEPMTGLKGYIAPSKYITYYFSKMLNDDIGYDLSDPSFGVEIAQNFEDKAYYFIFKLTDRLESLFGSVNYQVLLHKEVAQDDGQGSLEYVEQPLGCLQSAYVIMRGYIQVLYYSIKSDDMTQIELESIEGVDTPATRLYKAIHKGN